MSIFPEQRQELNGKDCEEDVIAGWLEMTIPDKPRSPKQRYQTTDLGSKVLDQWSGGE